MLLQQRIRNEDMASRWRGDGMDDDLAATAERKGAPIVVGS